MSIILNLKRFHSRATGPLEILRGDQVFDAKISQQHCSFAICWLKNEIFSNIWIFWANPAYLKFWEVLCLPIHLDHLKHISMERTVAMGSTLWKYLEGVNFLTQNLSPALQIQAILVKIWDIFSIFEYFKQILQNFHGTKESCAVELCLLYENCTEWMAVMSTLWKILKGVNFGPQNLSPAPQIQYILIKKVNYSFRKAFISFLLVGASYFPSPPQFACCSQPFELLATLFEILLCCRQKGPRFGTSKIHEIFRLWDLSLPFGGTSPWR